MVLPGTVRFHTLKGGSILKERRRLKSFLIQLCAKEGKTVDSLDFILCSDDELLDINRRFLKHDYFTDIITFDLSEGQNLIGEIHISIDRVKDNASTLQNTLQAELHRVIFHGVLHLCGYKDKTPGEKKIIRAKEDQYLSKYLK